MAYSDFTVEQIIDKFSHFVEQDLFASLKKYDSGAKSWLLETLAEVLVLTMSSEVKSRFDH